MAFSRPLLFSGCIAFAVFVFFASVPIIFPTKVLPISWLSPKALDNAIRAPRKNVWADLSREEAKEVRELVFSKPELNLAEATKASP